MGCSTNFENDVSTPMHCAAYYGHYQIIGLLLEYGISYNLKNKQGNLPIDETVSEEIKTLLSEANNDIILRLT